MYTAIGLDSLKQEKSHFQDFVKCKTSIVNTAKIVHFQKGNFAEENEVHAVSTIVGLLLPAIESFCFSYYEVGPAFIEGSVQRYLIGVTKDGFIQCPNGKACRNLKMGVSHDRKAVKIKYIPNL